MKMSADIAMKFYEMYNTKNVDLLDTLLAPGYIGQVNGRDIIGVDAAKGVIRDFLTAFPDVQYTVHDTIASGERVVTRWIATATHQGSFVGVEPTQKAVTMLGITIFQISGEQISALWSIWDLFGLVQQLRS
jgi:steroid delta-isomerase-like uncharacterized protein